MFIDTTEIVCCVVILSIPLVFVYCMYKCVRKEKINLKDGDVPLINDVENDMENKDKDLNNNLKDGDIEI
jgi:hypothetical protein